MAYFDNPLIPIKQQAPSAMFKLEGLDPLEVPSLYAYWNAQVDGSLFQDVAGNTPATVDAQPIQLWKELSGAQLDASEATIPPSLGISGGIKWVEFDGSQVISVPSSTDLFNFMHNGKGGEIIIVFQVDSGQGSGTNTVIANNAGVTSDIGFTLAVDPESPNEAYENLVTNGTLNEFVEFLSQTPGDYVTGTPHVHQSSYKVGLTPAATLLVDEVNVADIDGGTSALASPDDADFDLTFGRRAPALSTFALTGRIYSIAIFNEILDAETRKDVTFYLAEQAGFTVGSGDVPAQVFSPAAEYNDFIATSEEIFYTHPNLLYATRHDVFVKTLNGTAVEVTITFYAGDNVTKIEKLTDTAFDFIAPGTDRIGFKTTGSNTATVRNWSG